MGQQRRSCLTLPILLLPLVVGCANSSIEPVIQPPERNTLSVADGPDSDPSVNAVDSPVMPFVANPIGDVAGLVMIRSTLGTVIRATVLESSGPVYNTPDGLPPVRSDYPIATDYNLARKRLLVVVFQVESLLLDRVGDRVPDLLVGFQELSERDSIESMFVARPDDITFLAAPTELVAGDQVILFSQDVAQYHSLIRNDQSLKRAIKMQDALATNNRTDARIVLMRDWFKVAERGEHAMGRFHQVPIRLLLHHIGLLDEQVRASNEDLGGSSGQTNRRDTHGLRPPSTHPPR